MKKHLSLLATAFTLIAFSGHALSQDTTWGVGVGNWLTDGNWDNNAPNAGTDAFIQNGGTAELDGGAAGTANKVFLGIVSGSQGTLEVSGVGTTLTIDFDTVLGGQDNLSIGGNGILNISKGAIVNTGGFGIIGGIEDSSGTATIIGTDSAWNINENLILGGLVNFGGTGTMEITDGGTVTVTGDATIGFGTESEGTLTVTTDGRFEASTLVAAQNNGTATVTLASGGTMEIGGGTGVLILAQDSSTTATLNIGDFAGGTTSGNLLASEVALGFDNGFGSGFAILNFNQTDEITFAPLISGNTFGRVAQRGTGKTILATANTYGAETLVTGGTLNVRNNEALGIGGYVGVSSGATLEFESGITIASAFRTLVLKGNGVGGNGALRNISGDNTWLGNVWLDSSTRIQSEAGLLNLSGGIRVLGVDADLTVGGAGDTSLGSVQIGAGEVTKEGTGTLTINQAFGLGTNNYTGQTDVLDGTILAGNNQALSPFSRHFVDTTGILDTNNTASQVVGSLTGSGSVFIDNSFFFVGNDNTDFVFDGIISGAGGRLIKQGTGEMTLTDNNTHTGSTVISDGILTWGKNNAIAPGSDLLVNFENGTGNALANLAGFSQEIDTLILFATLAPNSTRVDLGVGGYLEITNAIEFKNIFAPIPPPPLGFGALIENGTVALNKVLDIDVAGNGNEADLEIRSQITGTGGIDFSATNDGVLLLSGSNSYTGGTEISSGILRTTNLLALGNGPGKVTLFGGVLDPVGTLQLTAPLNWQGGRIASTVGDVVDDEIVIFGGLNNLGGTDFEIRTGQDVALNTAYTLLKFSATDYVDPTVFQALSNDPNVVFNVTFDFDIPTQLRMTFLNVQATGAILQNSAPVNIPVIADFLVSGPVTTGEVFESNTINSLIFESGSSLQVFNNLTVTSGEMNVQPGTATIFGGNIITPGDFSKTGSGDLIANSVFNIAGAANIISGGLYVNNVFNVAQGLTVFQNALLGGSGVINGNVLNNGILAPGNSVGTLTINGNYTQSSSGTFQLEIANPGSFDQLFVSGNASLAGTLQVLNLGKSLKYGQQYAFLQASSISGEFDAIELPNSSRFRGRFLTNGGTGSLLVAPTSYTLVAETPNQKRVAKALDSYITARNNDRETVSIALDLQSEEQYPASFDQIAPTFHESVANISIEQAFAQTQILNQRLSSVRLGATGFQAIGIDAEPLVHDKDGKSVADAKDFKSQVIEAKPTAWSAWAMGNGFFGKATTVSQVPNYRFDTGGFLVGADYRWSENFSTGLYTGYQYTWADYNGGGSTQINSALFGGYASYTNGGFYTDAVVGGGYNGYRVRRPIEFSTIDRTARSNQNGGQFSAALNLGYDWEIGKFTLGPIAGVQYSYVGIAPFTEDGADSLDLRVGQQNANSLRTTFGGRIAYSWNVTDSVTLIPEVRMFWQHEFLNNPRNISSSLDGGAGPSFGYETSTPARDSVFAGAGLTAQFGPNWNAFFFYNADFGRQDYLGHYVSGGLGIKF